MIIVIKTFFILTQQYLKNFINQLYEFQIYFPLIVPFKLHNVTRKLCIFMSIHEILKVTSVISVKCNSRTNANAWCLRKDVANLSFSSIYTTSIRHIISKRMTSVSCLRSSSHVKFNYTIIQNRYKSCLVFGSEFITHSQHTKSLWSDMDGTADWYVSISF